MCILKFFARGKEKSSHGEEDIQNEEYQLPELSRSNFRMTEELQRRQQDERLRSKYEIAVEKEGNFV